MTIGCALHSGLERNRRDCTAMIATARRKLYAFAGIKCWRLMRAAHGATIINSWHNFSRYSAVMEGINLEQKVVAVLWPDEHNYQRLRDICAGDELHVTLESYRAAANAKLRQLEQDGMEIVRLEFDTEELLIFANEQGASVNARTRAEYAAHLCAKRDCS